MKFKIIVVILIIIFGLALTNPSKTEYLEWAQSTLVQNSTNIIERLGLEYFDKYLKEAVSAYTTVNNFTIFSIYETKGLDGNYISLGILNNFYFLTKVIDLTIQSPTVAEKEDNEYPSSFKPNRSDSNDISNSYENKSTSNPSTTEVVNALANEVINGLASFGEALYNGVSSTLEDTSEENEYYVYNDVLYGFSFAYPSNFATGEPQNTEFYQIPFISEVEQAAIVVECRNTGGSTIEEIYKAWTNEAGETISYKHIKDNWFVMSWADDDHVYYQKVYVGAEAMNIFVLIYPSSNRPYYENEVLPVLLQSFKPGNLDIPY